MKPNQSSVPDDLPFTGERFLPEVAGQIAFEHLHRYYVARQLAGGKRVLDVACGEGYGSFIIAAAAESVVGVDISAEAVLHASQRYKADNLSFVEASAASLPFEDASFDFVVSFETIEHHDRHEEMLDEIRRVLRPGGVLLISSPNKQHYSLDAQYQNPYHVKELFKHEFLALVGKRFKHVETLGQRVIYGSLLVRDTPGEFDSLVVDGERVVRGEDAERQAALRVPLYDVAMAGDDPLPALNSSLFEMPVHGMDPARFYGVHLPDRVAEADQRVNVLETQLTVAPMSTDESRMQFEALHEGLRGLHAHQIEVVNATSSGLSQLNGDWKQQVQQTSEATYSALAKRLDELLAGTAGLDQSLTAHASRLERQFGEALARSHSELSSLHILQGVAMSRLNEIAEQQRSSTERAQMAEAQSLQMQVEVRQLQEQNQQARTHLAAAEERVDTLGRVVADAALREQELKQDMELVQERLSRTSAALNTIEQSRTWRYSAWLRSLARFLRGRSE